jgi:hypothetical protein
MHSAACCNVDQHLDNSPQVYKEVLRRSLHKPFYPELGPESGASAGDGCSGLPACWGFPAAPALPVAAGRPPARGLQAVVALPPAAWPHDVQRHHQGSAALKRMTCLHAHLQESTLLSFHGCRRCACMATRQIVCTILLGWQCMWLAATAESSPVALLFQAGVFIVIVGDDILGT